MPPRAAMAANRPVASGQRDRTVTIQSLTETSGSSGFPVDDWATLPTITLDAHKLPLGGLERYTQNQLSAPYDTRWEIPYLPAMDPDLVNVPKERRLIYEGRTFDIVDAIRIGRREGIELLTLAKHG